MDNLTNGFAIAHVDGTEHTLEIFTEQNKENIILSTNLRLIDGEHTLSNFQLFNEDGMLLAEDTTEQLFTVDVSFTFELPVNLTLGNDLLQMAFSITGLDYGFAYIKAETVVAPPPPPPTDTVTVMMTGVLGIPDDEMYLYEDDILYNTRDVNTITKPVFEIQHTHTDADGISTDLGIVNFDWTSNEPLEITYEKTGNADDTDVFEIRTYRATVETVTPTNIGNNYNVTPDGKTEDSVTVWLDQTSNLAVGMPVRVRGDEDGRLDTIAHATIAGLELDNSGSIANTIVSLTPSSPEYINAYDIAEVDTLSGSIPKMGTVSDFKFEIKGDEDFELNDNGLVEFSMYPEGWKSNSTYQFFYTPIIFE